MKRILLLLTSLILITSCSNSTSFSSSVFSSEEPLFSSSEESKQSSITSSSEIKEYNIKLNEVKEARIHDFEQEDFVINRDYDDLYFKGIGEHSKPLAIRLSWNDPNHFSTKYKVYVSEEASFNNAWVFNTENLYFDLYNCKVATLYYWKVDNGVDYSDVSSFFTQDTLIRNINVDGVTNFRDLGGYINSDHKRIKQGMIYRSSRLNTSKIEADKKPIPEITKEGVDTFKKQLNIKFELDLRTSNYESGNLNGKSIVDGVNYQLVEMSYVSNMMLSNSGAVEIMFNEILPNENNYPLDFHCAIGTDRTGFIACTLLAILGVSEEDIVLDYMFSNYGKIGSERNVNDIYSHYLSFYKSLSGISLQDKVIKALVNGCSVSMESINKIKSLLIA